MTRAPRSTAYRLGAAFAAILALFGAALLVELGALDRIAQVQDELARLDHAKHAGHQVAADIREQYIHQAHTIIVEDGSHLDHYSQTALALRHATDQLVRIAESQGERHRGVEIARLARLADDEFRRDVVAVLARGDRAERLALHARTERQVRNAVLLVDELNRIFEARSLAALARTGTIRSEARLATIFCFALAILVSGAVGLLLMRSILRPIAALRESAERVGAGDLRARIDVSGRDELAVLARTFNRMTDDLARNQEALVRSQKLASIGQVAAGVAHEINNPLGVILGYVKVMKREPSLADREELQIIEDEAHQCRRIVEELLDLARPPRLEIAPVNLGEIARDTVARLTEAGRLEGIAVDVPTADAPEVLVPADDARIRQVVQNVVVNAVEAGAARITLEARYGDGGGLLVVADEGLGMPPEVQAHALDPFFTTKPRGTGLGLAIAQAILDAHNGRIEIISQPGEGTRVSLWLPAERA